MTTSKSFFSVKFRGDQFWFPTPSSEDHICKMMQRSGNFYEVRLLQFLCNRLDGSRWVVDCGANIGNHTVFFAGVLRRDVYAFEPIPDNIKALGMAIHKNKLDSVTIVNSAVGEKNGLVSLGQIQDGNSGTYSIYSDKKTNRVQMVSLDSYFSDVKPKGRCGILKIDVEGYEAKVLEGAENLLDEHRPLVVCECSSTQNFKEIEGLLKHLDYHSVGVFGKTPTVVFDRVERMTERKDVVLKVICQYEK